MSKNNISDVGGYILSKIQKTKSGCWEWSGSRNSWGYGQSYVDGKTIRSHRLSFSEFVGPIPTGMLVCHKCDNPACVNPDHLFLGTWLDNMSDMMRKGRKASNLGDSNGNSRLTSKDVIKIRKLYRPEIVSFNKLARKFKVTKTTIYAIIHKRIWGHLK